MCSQARTRLLGTPALVLAFIVLGSSNLIGCMDDSARLTELCGNGTCDDSEDAFSCTADCSTCGDGVCGPDENKASCMIDCDACAMGCDDGDPCTEDVCTSGGCVNTSVDFRIDGCVDGEHYLGCHDGSFGTHSAPQACVDHYPGINGFEGCTFANNKNTINCTWVRNNPGPCVVNRTNCLDLEGQENTPMLGLCTDFDGNGALKAMWDVYTCDEICRNSGFRTTSGCVVDSDTDAHCACVR